MGNCLFRINIDGHHQEFNSEEELHSFLRENKKLLSTSLLTDKIIFSKGRSKQDITDDVLKALSDNVKFEKDEHSYSVSNVEYTPVTKYIAKQKLVPEFNMDSWRNNKQTELLKQINLDGSQKYSLPEVSNIIRGLKENWETQSLVGTSFHTISQKFFEGSIETPVDILKLFPEMEGRDYILKKYISTLEDLKQKLIQKHGADVIFRPEVMLYDKDSKVAGTADLIVVDKDGKSHIYDYKTSTKDEGLWSQAKLLTIDYQLGMYRQILRRNNVDVDSVNYIPIEINDLDYEKKIINDFNTKPIKTLYLLEGDRVMKNINRLLPYDFSLKLQDVTSNKDVYAFLKEAFNYESARETNPEPLTVDEEFVKLKGRTGKDDKYYTLRNPINPKANKYIPITAPDSVIKRELESHLKYLNEYQRYLPIRFYDFVTYAKGQIEKGEKIDWETHWAKDAGTVNKMISLLSKYISDPAWKALQSDALYDLNTVAFENSETKQIDFISLSSNNLDSSPKLLRGNTLLGNFLIDGKAKFNAIPEKVTNGDVELFKLIAFIKANKDIFEDKVVGNMYAMNIYKNNTIPRVYTQTLDALSKQWDVLIKNIPSTLSIKNQNWDIKGIHYLDAFMQDINNMLDKPDFNPIGVKFIRKALEGLTLATEKEEKIQQLGRIAEKLTENIGYAPSTGVFRQPDASRLIYLASQAIMQLEDLPTIREHDMKKFANFLKENLNTSNPTSMVNQAMQNVVALTGKALNNTTHTFNAYKERVREITAELYKSQGVFAKIKVIGYNLDVFKNMFETVDGSLSGRRTMRLKDPDTAKDLTAAEAKYIREYTNILAEVRAQKLGMEGATELLTNDYKLNIPLMRASELTAFAGKNYKEWFKNYFRDIINPNNIYENDIDSTTLLKTQSKMFNFFDRYDIDLDARQEKLDRSESTEFETDLEAVMDMYFMIHSKEHEMNKVMPALNAQKMFTMFSEHYMFEDNETTAKAINDYIATVIFDKNLIAEESKSLAIGAQALKRIVSGASMAFAPVSAVTHVFIGWGNNITKTLANYFDTSAFGAKQLMQAATLVYGDLNTNKLSYENVSLGDNLNEMFRLSDMNLKELVHKVQTTSSGATKFGSHWAYWWQSFPVYTNRMIMFTAQMIKDGIIKVNGLGQPSRDSAIQMIDGKMVYNDKLDPRFSEYLASKDKPEHVQNASWKESRANYLKMQELLLQEPGGIKSDGSLARPYDNKTKDSLKTAADDVHGNFDKDTRTRMEQLAFGKIFLQFKTYVTAKKNRWYMETHPDERRGQWVTEWHDGTPVKMWKGKITEGIWQTLCALTNEVKNNRGDIVKSWKDMHMSQKQNVALMLGDILQFGIYSLMLGLIGYEALKKDDPLQAELLRGLSNSTQDLWIGNAVTSFTGNQNPVALLSWGTSVMNNSWGVITGKPNAATSLMDNVALFRTLHRMTK